MEVRAKDKVFLAVALPLAAVAAYVWMWRIDAAKTIASLERLHGTLVAVEDFPAELARAQSQLDASAAELEAARNAAWPQKKIVYDCDASFACRESDVIGVFREAGLVVMRSEALSAPSAGEETGGKAIMDARGRQRGWGAELRRYTLDGTYPSVKRALDAFAARQMAVVPEAVSMRGGVTRWTIELWL